MNVMKSLVVLCVLAAVVNTHAMISDFDGLPLANNSYWNGSDESGGFTDGDAYYLNNYNPSWGSWNGFAYSNVNNTDTAGFLNQYAAITGTDVSGTGNYAVGYMTASLSFGAATGEDYDTTISGAYFTNTTYAYLSMRDGDDYAKKFGGETGNDADFFKLSIKGIDAEGNYTANTVDFYLADFRFADNNEDYIVDEWTWVDLTSLGDIIGLEFSFESSDTSDWGINTPTYFAMDALNAVPEPASMALLGLGGLLLRRKK